jgi:hypothetical protein
MTLGLTPGSPSSAGAEIANAEGMLLSMVGACAPRTAPMPAALDPISGIVSDILRSLAPKFAGTTCDGSGKHFNAAAALPRVDAEYLGVDVHGGGIVDTNNMNFRIK